MTMIFNGLLGVFNKLEAFNQLFGGHRNVFPLSLPMWTYIGILIKCTFCIFHEEMTLNEYSESLMQKEKFKKKAENNKRAAS